MTEDEAKTKLCCGPRVMAAAVSAAAPKNGASIKEVERSFMCCGSACMAWHWVDGYEPATLEHMRAADMTAPEPIGFCGLAGAPR